MSRRTATAIAVGLALCMGVVACERRAKRDDVVITGDVQNQLSAAGLPGAIVVATSKGVVTLTGGVPDVRAKARAGEVAVKVPGVARVDNELKVTMAGDVPIQPPRPNMVPPNAPPIEQGRPPNAPPAP